MASVQELLTTAPMFGLGMYCLSHVAACRLLRGRGPYFSLMLGCGLGMAAMLAATGAALVAAQSRPADALASTAMNLVCYLALSFGYFNFINLNIASLRIRMLQELAESGGRMPADELTKLYDVDAVIAVRIDRLAAGGHLVERQGRFFSGKRRFLVVGRTFDFFRLAILGSRLPRAAAGRRQAVLEAVNGAGGAS